MIDAPGIFVMGTDTGVGKTVVAASIALAARSQGRTAAPLKPAQTGAPPVGDAEFAAALLGLHEPLEAIRPYALEAPLAPMVAASLEGVRLEPAVVAEAFAALSARYDLVVVEAAGGALVIVGGGGPIGIHKFLQFRLIVRL